MPRSLRLRFVDFDVRMWLRYAVARFTFPLEVTLRARAFDDHVTLVASNYAGDLPYLCSNYPAYTGQPLGRGCVIDRAGIILADTGVRPGVAVAPVDLARPKDVYHLTFKEDRSLFHYLADADVKRTVFKGPQRKIRVSIATVGFEHGPSPRPDSEFAKILDEAGKLGSDVILMTEFGLATDDENGRQTLALVAEKARQYRSYIIIGGLGTVTGAFFGVIHLTPQLLLSMIVFGIFLGYLFMATSNLAYPILAHALLNSFSYVQLLILPEEELASAPTYARDPWAIGLSVLIVAYLCVRIKKAGAGLAKTT